MSIVKKSIGSDHFWSVILPLADANFEVIGSSLACAKDATNVWMSNVLLPGVDPKTVELVNAGFVWKDATSVWHQKAKIPGADAKTFRHLDQAFYRDANRVYWSSTPLDGADQKSIDRSGRLELSKKIPLQLRTHNLGKPVRRI